MVPYGWASQARETVMTATFDQARHLLKVVAEKHLSKVQVIALHDSGLLTDLLEAARCDLAKVDRIIFRHVLGLSPQEDKEAEHVIDLDANPFIPNDWAVEEHKQGGQFAWDPAKVALYLSKEQQGVKCIMGNNLREEMKSKPVYNANLLDHLLAHQHLIPEEWKGKFVFFWGTIYRDRSGDLRVRCLLWNGDRWYWHASWLFSDWSGSNPAAVPAS